MTTQPPAAPFQKRVLTWMMECFSMQVCRDSIERNHRFLEEAIELVQSNGCTVSEAHQLVDYVFNRPVGEIKQECGGVMVTLAALSLAADIDMHDCGEVELSRIMQPGIMEKIRAKQAAKPKHSPLPQTAAPDELMRVAKELSDKINRNRENIVGGYGGESQIDMIASALQSAGARQAAQVEPTQAEIDGVSDVLEKAAEDPIARSSGYIMTKMLKRVFVKPLHPTTKMMEK